MRDAVLERLVLAEFGIHVVREEIARMPGVKDDVRLGDGAAQRLPRGAHGVVLEKLLLLHLFPPVLARLHFLS
jgi:hypothetical protein